MVKIVCQSFTLIVLLLLSDAISAMFMELLQVLNVTLRTDSDLDYVLHAQTFTLFFPASALIAFQLESEVFENLIWTKQRKLSEN